MQFVSLSVHGHPSSVSPQGHQRRELKSKIKLLGNRYNSDLRLCSILSLNRENNLKGYFSWQLLNETMEVRIVKKEAASRKELLKSV